MENMPKQELFLQLKRSDYAVSVFKTYDGGFAREAFDSMDQTALDDLARSLRLEENFEPSDIPATDAIEYNDFLWEALVDSASEDGHLRSYFVVETQTPTLGQQLVFVAGDWPSAEAFAKSIAQPDFATV
jgi:hypothetical protein